MTDERPGTPSDGDAPADQQDPDVQPDPGPAPAAADPRTTIAGRYTVDLQAPPTTTGIAISHAGRDLRTREPVIIKTLRLEYRGDPEMRARFRREARLLQFLTHPNVIRALMFTEERGAPWLVLERVPGRTLREEIGRGAPYSPEAVVPLLQGIAAALDHLHARGLVHLDVRPENIVVGPGGDVKLVDFGVAQTAGTMQSTSDHAAPESVAYLAPEQVSGDPVSPASDIYALGCVVYELLTARPPYGAETTPATRNAAIRARLEESPLPPTAARGTALPAWVDEVVLEALQRNPRQRYGSAGSFAAVFHSGVEGDIDVETGRPRLPVTASQRRRVPNNEPGIAMKGSPRLAARRGTREHDMAESGDSEVVDATFSSVAQVKPIAYADARRVRDLDLGRLSRRLWLAVVVAAALNILLMAALVVTRGELPGIGPWNRGGEIGPGATVRVAGTGLVARAEPAPGAQIVADLPDGGTVHISGEAVQSDGERWWPVEVTTGDGVVQGYVPESWVQAP